MNQVNKDLNKDQTAPHVLLPNVIKVPALPKTAVIATKTVEDAVMRLAELKRQEKTLKKLIDAERAIIEPYMGDAVELLDPIGNELVTWRYDADRQDLDKEALKLNFADVYYACTTTVKGSRKLVVKV